MNELTNFANPVAKPETFDQIDRKSTRLNSSHT